uniref:NADPH-dependent FMN reductase n=1 Tax=uncultured Thiotrichaceae bacterium TaxID=298394 RepID=A0A6S6SN50_9GAMM|nr:MAG: NADPH-dependent FMN reductase [uncultured Thiotrichaceae bacterium]
MNITIVSGSHRENSQSEKVARFVKSTLEKAGNQADIFSLANNPLPLWDEGIWSGDEKWSKLLTPLSEQLAASDAFVIIAPEWHGQVPSGLKNFFLLWGNGELAHKPALIIAVSSSDGGAYPIAELRMSSYKNNRICYIPEQVIVRNVESVLNDDPAQNNADSDDYFRRRISWTLEMLVEYGEALKIVRDKGNTHNQNFSNGM